MDTIFRNVSDVLREERDMNMIHFLRDKEMEYTKSKGKEKVIYANKRKDNAYPGLGHLRDKNIGIVIREGRDLEMAQAKSKEKEKLISASKGKENAFPMETNDSTISKAALAQRKRRERERSSKNRPSYQSGQRLRPGPAQG